MNGGENFQSGAWNHHAIRTAVDALNPAESGAVAAAWDDLGRAFQESVSAFHDATRAAIDNGWRGPTAAAVASTVENYAARAEHVSGRFTEIGNALRVATAGAEAVRGAVGQPLEPPADWTRVLPANWTAAAEADAAEQNAKAAMQTQYASANREADEQLPADGLAATHPASTAQPVGLDVGPNGVHGIPSDQQVAEPDSEADTSDEHRKGDEDFRPETSQETAQAAPGSIAGAAVAGAVGGGVAQYAHSVVAAHRTPTPERPSTPAAPADRDDEEEPPTYLESIDEGGELVGKLPLVTPAVIGK
ncbi:hypothetical protein FXW78_37785 [Rhodococcus opacus]|nr:hypothetical protein [Rhodococcus opacus]RZK96377.1 MAG: hypothetical protein EOP30_00460 [Rhodococcus sp. (in: high G+C Gram-positive bacteria)]